MMSMRVPEQLVDDLKLLAAAHGVPYQTLVKRVLRAEADDALRAIARGATIPALRGTP